MKELNNFKKYLVKEEISNSIIGKPKYTEHEFYELKIKGVGLDGYKVLSRIDSSVGYKNARKIADILTRGQFSKLEGTNYKLEDSIINMAIYSM